MDQKIIPVVGASRGIGRELVQQLSANPDHHVIASEQSIFDHGSVGSYSLTKAAGNMMIIQLHHELCEKGFTCVAVHPGWVAADMGRAGDMSMEESVVGYVKVL
ncbi:hypothetical protein BO83DRAFT_392640 [Aspergillus eucalypticola CBS 122712]|uniref:NAD(P)-binding protein n=1 Tax=Aspergillus eucalypticola (strain CBS 122712 / IBT 29274) TaxID=1448314 RepID=A0A317UQP6_ASPEC|nr:uncharacterized protein BO83DRAFT_392640 [Aspergillus eucalypticola CBS 122712]PWY64323.1 hypothetical protein BO83DRAFT_392640 [Aspergillus eucalypticola CBS 122712]